MLSPRKKVLTINCRRVENQIICFSLSLKKIRYCVNKIELFGVVLSSNCFKNNVYIRKISPVVTTRCKTRPVNCDTSFVEFRAQLEQLTAMGGKQYHLFFAHEVRYSSNEFDFLGVVVSSKNFTNNSQGKEFIVVTDRRSFRSKKT